MDFRWFGLLLHLYQFVIFVRVILSWVAVDWKRGIPGFIFAITEPVLEPLRSFLPGRGIGMDLSPLVIIVILEVLLSVFK